MTVNVVGLDLSMTGTGVARAVEGSARTYLIKTKGTGDDRLLVIRDRVREATESAGLVLIEGYLNQSMSAGITGMVHGAVRSMLIEDGTPYATLPPSSLKKYATGRGGANKPDMAVAAFKRGGVEFTNDNECDAWWLWVAAMEHLGEPVFDLPKVHRDALDKIKMEFG